MQTVENLIIGAGSVGSSVAFHLAERGRPVLVLDRQGIGVGTTSAAFGLAWAAGKGPAPYLRLTLASQRYFPDFLDAVGDRVDYVQNGGLIVFDTPERRDRVWGVIEPLLGVDGFRAELLSPTEAREYEPLLGPEIVGAAFSPHEGHLDPTLLVRAVATAAQARGARFEVAEVTGIEASGDGWRVTTPAETYLAERVVICGGAWTPGLAALAGAEVPVALDKGQVLESAPQPPLLRYPTMDVRQAGDGRIWMGTIHAGDLGFDFSISDEHARQIKAILAAQFPSLADLPIERAVAAPRPIPPGGLPIAGEFSDRPGLYVVVGHSGITLAPIHGRLMADLLETGRVDPLLEPFTPAARLGGDRVAAPAAPH